MTAASLPYRIGNPEEIGRNMLRLFRESTRALSTLLDRPDAKLSPYSTASEISEAAETVVEIARIWTSDPVKLVEVHGALARSYLELWGNSVRRLFGEGSSPSSRPSPPITASKTRRGRATPISISASRPICSRRSGPRRYFYKQTGWTRRRVGKRIGISARSLARFRRQTSL